VRIAPMLLAALLLVPLSAAADLKVELTKARIARGEYLVMNVAGCDGCHAERAMDRYAYPPKQSMMMAGGLIFPEVNVATPNITPYGIGNWTDQQIFDALTKGVARDGHVLNPAMPYQVYGNLDREELYAIIAYLRTLKPIKAGPYPGYHEGKFEQVETKPGSMPRPGPDASDVDEGRYLVTIADCDGCHHGPEKSDAPYMGGTEFKLVGLGLIRSANLTPDKSTGIGAWTRNTFIARFKGMRGQEKVEVERGQPNTAMHWWAFSYMTDEDLGAIYSYLRTMKPVRNAVVKFEPLLGDFKSPNFSERQ
jgi:mono/diheme cytochrome c family protein